MKSRIKKYTVNTVSILILAGISIAYASSIDYAPDEENHISMVLYHSAHLSLSDWNDWRYGTERGHAYHLFSPLPYLTYVPFAWIANENGISEGKELRRWLRWGGIPIAILQFLITLAVCRCLINNEWTGLGAAIVINLIPQLRYLHAYVNADSLTILWSSVAFWLLVRLIQARRITLADAVLSGLSIAIVAHGKYNGYPLGGLLALVLLIQVFRHVDSWRERYRLLGVVVVTPLLLTAWFYLWVYAELGNGHFLAGEDHLQLMQSTFNGTPDLPALLLWDRIQLMLFTWTSFWGDFVGNPRLPYWLAAIFLALVLISYSGAIWKWRCDANKSIMTTLIIAGPGLAIGTYLSIARLVAPQGRLVMPVVIPIMLCIFFGAAFILSHWDRDSDRAMRNAVGLWGIGLLAANAYMLRHTIFNTLT